MRRDIDEIIDRVRRRIPVVDIHQLQVMHPGADDDGLWFFCLPGVAKNIQLESPHGRLPFLVEHSDMTSTAEAMTVATVEDAERQIMSYLTRIGGL